MTWGEAAILCNKQVPLISKHLPFGYWDDHPHWEQRVRKLFAEEARVRAEVENIVLGFCITRQWPKMPAGSTNFLTCSRLLAGAATAEVLAVGDLVPQCEASEPGLLEWLLIDTWNAWRSDEFLKLQALASFGGPLYAAPELPNYWN